MKCDQTMPSKTFLFNNLLSLLIPFFVLTSLTERAYGDLVWSNSDIGTSIGSMDIADGTFTVVVDGADISDCYDNFHFVYQKLSGDGQVIARVNDMGNGSNAWCKAGVMIRETLTPESEYAMTFITGGGRQWWRFSMAVGCGGHDGCGVLSCRYRISAVLGQNRPGR